MDFAKARQSYETVFSLLRELKDEQSVPQLFRAARHVFSLNTFVSRQGGTDSGSIWKERVDDLHGQLASAVVKFLQQFSQISEQYGNACLSLLYVGSEACERFEQEKEALLTQLTLERGKNAELNKTLESQLKDSALKENLELRTRLVVQQQNTMQREAETRELVQRLQKTLAEKNALYIEKERLAKERTRNFQILERQATAISQLMDESENNAKQKDQALDSLKMINEDNKIMTMNLERHSKVIEDLINVNAEMIDAANCYAQMQDWDESHPKEAHPLLIYSVDDNHDGETNFYSAEPVTVDEDCKISSCAVEKAQTRSAVLDEKVLVTGQVSEQTEQTKAKRNPSSCRQHLSFC